MSKPILAILVIVSTIAVLTQMTECGTPLSSLVKDPLKFGAFNIQVFGVTKFAKEDIVGHIIKIIQRYDVVLVQEIRDSSEEVIYDLIERVNSEQSESERYQLVVSDRLGRTSSKEQYAFVYKPSKLEVKDAYVFNDDNGDVFEREPYVVWFRSTVTSLADFAVIGCHVKPSDAISEINNLAIVYDDLLERHSHLKDVIFAGDFNADCSYVGKTKWQQVTFRSDDRFVWLLDDDADTTVAKSSCAYDRFVIAGEGMARAYVPGSANVFYFDHAFGLDFETAMDVSDHYPIELGLMPNTDIVNDDSTDPRVEL